MNPAIPSNDVTLTQGVPVQASPTVGPPGLGVLEGFAGPTTPSIPTPGLSSAVTRIPSGPTIAEEPSQTWLMAQLATQLYGVNGAGIQGAPELLQQPNVPLAAANTPEVTDHPQVPVQAPVGIQQFPRSTFGGPVNPFSAEPRFDAVSIPDTFSIPLLDSTFAPATPEPAPAPVSAPSPETPVVAQTLAPESSSLPTSASPTGWDVLTLDLRPSRSNGFDAASLREEFPILRERVHGKRLVWLDNAATTQKPQAVIDRLVYYYEHENSNIHRAAHALAARATDAYESARESVRRTFNARSVNEVVFVRGATEGINLVAQAWGRRYIEAGDEIVITWLEHHANIVPWQMLAKEKGARLRVAPVDDTGQILLDDFERLLNEKTKLVALPQVSNALGTVTPAKAMVDMAHRHGAKVLVDGAQSVSHMRVDVQALDADFFVFSGHKVFAPTGIGCVIAKESILNEMPPWQGGGNMIQDVTFERTVFQPPPSRFEAGTGNIADAVGLGAALDWLSRVGIENVERHEHDLLVYGTERLCRVPGLTMIGTAKEKAGVLSFVIDGHNTQDVSTYLDKEGIAVRGGHHCAQPILRRFGKESTVRASLAPYNTREDLDVLADALCKLVGGALR